MKCIYEVYEGNSMYTFKQYRTDKNNSGSAKAALEFGFLWLSIHDDFHSHGFPNASPQGKEGPCSYLVCLVTLKKCVRS